MFTFTLLLYFWAGLATPAYLPNVPGLPAHVPNEAANLAAAKEQLTWSTIRRLSWNDFKAAPEEENPHHALTAANLAVDLHSNAQKLQYDVKCVFLPEQSWTKNKESQKLLEHEQLHFDLTEVHARLLRKQLQQLSSCTDINGRLNAVVKNAFQRWKAEQQAFDSASEHGLNEAVEQQWAANTAQRLEALKAYQ